MNYAELPMKLMVKLDTPVPITDLVEDMHMVRSRIKAELGDRVSNFMVMNDPDIKGIYVTFELAPLFKTGDTQ